MTSFFVRKDGIFFLQINGIKSRKNPFDYFLAQSVQKVIQAKFKS